MDRASIDKIADETIGDIIWLSLPTKSRGLERSRYRWKYNYVGLQVCSRWRKVVKSQARFWSLLDFKDKCADMKATCLERAAFMPLQVLGVADESFTLDTRPLLATLLELSDRINMLGIQYGTCYDGMEKVLSIISKPVMPQLEDLSLCMRDIALIKRVLCGQEGTLDLHAIHFPHLKFLHLDNLRLSAPEGTLSRGLKELYLRTSISCDSITMGYFLKAISGCVCLEVLFIHTNLLPETPSSVMPAPLPTVHLPALRDLNLSTMEDTNVAHLLRHLSVSESSLCTVSIHAFGATVSDVIPLDCGVLSTKTPFEIELTVYFISSGALTVRVHAIPDSRRRSWDKSVLISGMALVEPRAPALSYIAEVCGSDSVTALSIKESKGDAGCSEAYAELFSAVPNVETIILMGVVIESLRGLRYSSDPEERLCIVCPKLANLSITGISNLTQCLEALEVTIAARNGAGHPIDKLRMSFGNEHAILQRDYLQHLEGVTFIILSGDFEIQ